MDTEHSFSCGQLQVNLLQHDISSQSFQAKLVIEFWSCTPLLHLNLAEDVIGVHMKGLEKSKDKAKEVDKGDCGLEVLVVE